MITIDTRRKKEYSQLIPAMQGMYTSAAGSKLEIIMDDEQAFKDLKEFLSEQGIGFREIYSDNRMVLEFKAQ